MAADVPPPRPRHHPPVAGEIRRTAADRPEDGRRARPRTAAVAAAISATRPAAPSLLPAVSGAIGRLLLTIPSYAVCRAARTTRASAATDRQAADCHGARHSHPRSVMNWSASRKSLCSRPRSSTRDSPSRDWPRPPGQRRQPSAAPTSEAGRIAVRCVWAPQRDREVNDLLQLGKTLQSLEEIQQQQLEIQREEGAIARRPRRPGRMRRRRARGEERRPRRHGPWRRDAPDASQEQTDVDSFAALEPSAAKRSCWRCSCCSTRQPADADRAPDDGPRRRHARRQRQPRRLATRRRC
jgi:hypothetical protein